MMPEKPSCRFILGQMSFHQAGAEWYATHDQKQMAEWSANLVEEWRSKLVMLYPAYIEAEKKAGRWVN